MALTPAQVSPISCSAHPTPSMSPSDLEPPDTSANYFGYYGQDTWHVNKNLTINAGLRWEPWFPEFEKNNVGGGFNLDNFNNNIVSSVFTNAPAGLVFYGDKGVERGFIKRRLTNFSPRFGFALDPRGDGKQSLRASYTLTFEAPELYYDSGFPINAPYASAQNLTLDNSTNLTDAVKSFDNPWKKIAGGNPFPSQYPPSSTAAFPAGNIATQVYPPNLRRTYMHQYNASYQNQVSANWLLSASYIGTHTVHLWGFTPVNYATPLPTPAGGAPSTNNTAQRYILYRAAVAKGTTAGTRYSAFNSTADYGMANYNGVIVTANHRIANNFSVLANYTWSHCLSNLNYTGDNTPPAQDPNNTAAEYASCNFDIKHNLTVSGVLTSPRLKQRTLNLLAGAWQLSPLVSIRSGSPYTVTLGTDNSLTNIGQDRPNVVPGTAVYAKNFFPANSKNPAWINPAAYRVPTLGTFGNERPFLSSRSQLRQRRYGNQQALSDLRARATRGARRGIQSSQSPQLQQSRDGHQLHLDVWPHHQHRDGRTPVADCCQDYVLRDVELSGPACAAVSRKLSFDLRSDLL